MMREYICASAIVIFAVRWNHARDCNLDDWKANFHNHATDTITYTVSCAMPANKWWCKDAKNAKRKTDLLGTVYTCDCAIVRLWVRFPAQGGLQLHFQLISPEMCCQAVVIGVRRIIKTRNPLLANCARNRTAIRTQNRTRGNRPLGPHSNSTASSVFPAPDGCLGC
jgi:hypothetical protein